jgi:hypothetical protein
MGGERLDAWQFHAFNVGLHAATVAVLVLVVAVSVFPPSWG